MKTKLKTKPAFGLNLKKRLGKTNPTDISLRRLHLVLPSVSLIPIPNAAAGFRKTSLQGTGIHGRNYSMQYSIIYGVHDEGQSQQRPGRYPDLLRWSDSVEYEVPR